MQKAATVMVEWLTSAAVDSPSNALKQTLLEGTSGADDHAGLLL
jgi:hypothetical protein